MAYRDPAYVCDECKNKVQSPKPQPTLLERKTIYAVRLTFWLFVFAVGSIFGDNYILTHHFVGEGVIWALAVMEGFAGIFIACIVANYIEKLE